MCNKILVLLAAVASATVFTGCDAGRTQMGPRETNVLGAYKYQQEDYSHTGPNTFPISTDELYARRNFSGDKATFLWGLVTLKDY